MRISVDGRRIRNNKVAFSNLSGIVWMGPQLSSAVRNSSQYVDHVMPLCLLLITHALAGGVHPGNFRTRSF